MDVVALGELLIDFTENGTSAQDNKLFEANPGGAPCNVLAMLQKLGHQTAFIGKVGQDAFGRLLVDAVKEQGIDTCAMMIMSIPLLHLSRPQQTETEISHFTEIREQI